MIVSIEAVKAEAGIVGDADDDWIEVAIDAATRAAESVTGRTFEEVEATAMVRVSMPCGRLILPHYPIVGMSSVTVNGVDVDAELDPATGEVWRIAAGRRVPWLPGYPVEIGYTAGYVVPPADVARAVLLIVVDWYRNRGRDGSIRSEEVDGVGSTTWARPAGLAPEAMVLLAPYRVTAVA